MFKHLNFRKLISQLKLNTPKALIPNLLRAISQVISRYGKLSPPFTHRKNGPSELLLYIHCNTITLILFSKGPFRIYQPRLAKSSNISFAVST